MFSRLNHLAITTDQYTLLGMFYRAYFGMKVSGVTEREQSAISVGDGYVGVTLIPRRPGRRGGLDHFGIEVEDFDLSQPGHDNRAEVYEMDSWKQEMSIDHFGIRVREPERVAAFYSDVFELEARNVDIDDGSYHLTDGRVTLSILPWKISDFNGTGIEQPAMDHIGFRTSDLDAFIKNAEKLKTQNPGLWPRDIAFNDEGEARLALLKRCPHGSFQLADPDGTLIDIHQDH